MAGFYLDGVTGASTPDSLDPSFAADPAKWINRRFSEAKQLGLAYAISQPQGRVAGLYSSNVFAALLPQVRTALCAIPEPWGLYTGWPVANDWPGSPTKLDTMPSETGARVAALNERRAWAAANIAPLMALSKLRWVIADFSTNDPAGLQAAENYLRRHETIDLIGEGPPTNPGVGNDLLLNTAVVRANPGIGWLGAWDFFCRDRRLHLTPVPIGCTVHLVVVPEFKAPDFQNPVNFPDLHQIGIAKGHGYTVGLGGGWPLDQAKRILAAPAVTPTDPV